MCKTVLFHCSLPVFDEDGEIVVKENGKFKKEAPTHTLAFRKFSGSVILMSWAVAHSELDAYSKKIGRSIVNARLDLLEEGFGDAEVVELEGLTNDVIPHRVNEDNLGFYINKSVEILFTEAEIEDNHISLAFCSVDKDICEVSVDFTEVVDEELSGEKNDSALATADYIFATHENEDGEVVSHVQTKRVFDADGYSSEVDEDMGNILGPVLNDGGFLIVDEQQPIMVHEHLTEIEVIRYLKSKGLAYSNDLEEVVLS